MRSASASGIKRVQPGVPTGGQFAATKHTESELTLTDPGPDSIVGRDTVFTQRYENMEGKLAAIHEELSAAVADLRGDQGWNDMLEVAGKFHHYSLNNQMLIAIQTRGQATRVAGFRKWQEFNRQVRKGEKGIAVLAPKTIRVGLKDTAGNPVLDEKGKPRKRSAIVGFTTATVFDISQTEGEDLPDIETAMLLSEDPPAGFTEDLESAITQAGYAVSYEEIKGTDRGFTDPVGKRVVIREGLPPANVASTLAHELGHIKAGHLDRMDGYHMGHGGQRDAMEIEAESIAYTLCRVNGLDPVGKSARYVASWGNTDPERVKQAAETVTKTVKTILGSHHWRNVPGQEEEKEEAA